MDTRAGDLHDWEELAAGNTSPTAAAGNSSPTAAASDSSSPTPAACSPTTPSRNPLDDTDSGAIQPNYFSISPALSLIDSDAASAASENPSWIDPPPYSHFSDSEKSELHEPDMLTDSDEPVKKGLRPSPSPPPPPATAAWWNLVKMWVIRIKPIWSVIGVAAVVSVVMLGRKLYRLKQKGKSISIRVGIDEKKASYFMGRAVRLNEAFSMVKRMPIVRPSLPAGGVTPWPVVGLL